MNTNELKIDERTNTMMHIRCNATIRMIDGTALFACDCYRYTDEFLSDAYRDITRRNNERDQLDALFATK